MLIPPAVFNLYYRYIGIFLFQSSALIAPIGYLPVI